MVTLKPTWLLNEMAMSPLFRGRERLYKLNSIFYRVVTGDESTAQAHGCQLRTGTTVLVTQVVTKFSAEGMVAPTN